MNKNEDQPFFCDLTAIPADMREKHLAAIPAIFQTAQAVQDLPNGLAFRFQNEHGRFRSLADFIEYEQLCCPFEGLAIEIEPNGGSIWLRLTGGEGYKEFLVTGLQDMQRGVDSIQRTLADEDALQFMVDELTPTMAALMQKTTRQSS